MPALLERVNAIVDERERMLGVLGGSIPTVKPYPSKANFILCQLPEGTRSGRLRRASATAASSCATGTIPRLKDCVRTSVGLPEENDAVAAALAELTGGA